MQMLCLTLTAPQALLNSSVLPCRQLADTPQTLQESIDTCPVDCIHWVSAEQLAVLEVIMALAACCAQQGQLLHALLVLAVA